MQDLFVINGKQLDITSLTFVFSSSSCGLKPALNANKVRQAYFDKDESVQRLHSVSLSWQSQYHQCMTRACTRVARLTAFAYRA